jgi:pectate lyase
MSGFTNYFSARRVSWVVGILWMLGGWAAASAQYGSSFPGAEGFGSRSKGGRGGRVLIVDSLEDKVGNPAEGSLRWALQESGKRIIVFRVAGTIELAGKLRIYNPFVTVAGQTAPGGGITLKDYPLVVETNHVILQGLRMRVGPGRLNNSDSMNIAGPSAFNIVVDHCSLSWSTDEVLGTSDSSRNITLQNSIFSEGLDCSIHPEGCHSRGLLTRDGSRNITYRQNYFAHNDFRNPKMFGDPAVLNGTKTTYDFYNNVVYNWGDWAVLGAGASRVNVEGNYFRLGPSTYGYPDSSLEIRSTDEVEGSYRLWVDGNYGPSCPSGCVDDWDEMVFSTADQYRAPSRNRTPPAEILGAIEARNLVMAEAGASYRLNNAGNRVSRRDEVDQRVVNEFWASNGSIIDDPAQVGGWPLLDVGTPVTDSDLDGMPDLWENTHGLDPNDDIFEIDPNQVD